MKKTLPRKTLSLSTETIRALQADELASVAGAGWPTRSFVRDTCPTIATCFVSCVAICELK